MSLNVLITGGSSGLGKALGEIVRAEGGQVVIVDRRSPARASNQIYIDCDLSDQNGIELALPTIEAAGPYDLVFVNAGVSATGKFEDIPFDAYRTLLRINLESPFILTSELIRRNLITDSICFVSSLSHYVGYPGAAVYAASKDALAVYAKSIDKPFAELGVKVSVAYPGPIDTEHAARHAPRGADSSKRMAAEVAAKAIYDGVLEGRRRIVPGGANKLFALAGYLFPGLITQQMRKLIYDKLDEQVW